MKKVTVKGLFINNLSILGAVFLLACSMPGISAKAEIITKQETYTENKNKNDIRISENGELVIDSAHVTVKHEVIVSGNLILKNGAILEVGEEYLQKSGKLIVESGCKLEVKGEFRVQNKGVTSASSYSTSSGSIETKTGSEIRANKDFIIDTTGDISGANGSFYLDGNVSLETRDATDSGMNIYLTNTEPQTLSMSENISVGSLTNTCPTVNVNKYINIQTIKNDVTFKNSENVLYISRGQNKSDKNKVTYDGSLVVAGPSTESLLGNSILRNDHSGIIKVNGDLKALKGKVEIDGSLDVAGSLLFEQQDSEGKAGSVTSSLTGGSKAIITVGKDYIWNSTGNLAASGKMELSGNYTDKQGKNWLGTVRLVNRDQYVTIQNGGKINILEVAYSKNDYHFAPDNCWVKLVEGVSSGEPSEDDDNPGNTDPVEGNGNGGDNNSGGSGKITGDMSLIDLISIIGNNPSQGSDSGSGTTAPAETTPAAQQQTTTTTTQETTQVNASKGKLDKSLKVVKISSISTKSKQLTFKYKKISDIAGYEYQCSTSSKFKNAKTKKIGAKKTSYTVKKLKSGKTYYVRVRIYKNTPDGKIYSKWSKVKKIKVK